MLKKIFIILLILLGLSNLSFAEDEEIFDEAFWEETAENVEYDGEVMLNYELLDNDILKISVVGKNFISPILGLAFHLQYEKEKLAFLRYEPGEFLERGGDPFYLVKDETEKGEIVFGETLKKDDSFPLGDGEFATFYFEILNDNEFKFVFDKGTVSGVESVLQDLKKINWINLEIDSGSQNFGPNLISPKFVYPNLGYFATAAAIFIVLVIVFKLKKKNKEKKASLSVNFK